MDGPADDAVYELGGPAFTMPELAEVVSEETGQSVTYTDLSAQDYQAFLVRAGLPEPAAAAIADLDRAVAAGELYVETADLEKLLGRPATRLRIAVAGCAARSAVNSSLAPDESYG
jgi:NAD(P)H dehydrogenase (quinone)